MSKCEVYTGLQIFHYLLLGRAPENNYGDLSKKKQTNKYKEKLAILQS